MKAVGIVTFLVQIVFLVWDAIKTAIKEHNDDVDVYRSCAQPWWFVLNCTQGLVLGFFMLVGVYILRASKNYEPETDLARKLHDKHKKEYTCLLLVCILTFFVLIFSQNLYTTLLYFRERNQQHPSCSRITSSWSLNQGIWLSQRLLAYCLWVVPFIYMFWQDINKKLRHHKERAIKAQNDGVNYYAH